MGKKWTVVVFDYSDGKTRPSGYRMNRHVALHVAKWWPTGPTRSIAVACRADEVTEVLEGVVRWNVIASDGRRTRLLWQGLTTPEVAARMRAWQHDDRILIPFPLLSA